jgi:hypothetical protein
MAVRPLNIGSPFFEGEHFYLQFDIGAGILSLTNLVQFSIIEKGYQKDTCIEEYGQQTSHF